MREEALATAYFILAFTVLPKMVKCWGFTTPSIDMALQFILCFLWVSWKGDNNLFYVSTKSSEPEASSPFLKQGGRQG